MPDDEEEFEEAPEEIKRVTAKTVSLSITLPTRMVAKIDALRGDVARSRWISRKLESIVFPVKIR